MKKNKIFLPKTTKNLMNNTKLTQIASKNCRFFMARKGILPRRKRGRASTASTDVDEVNNSPHHRQANVLDVDTCNTNTLNTDQS